MSQFSFKTYPRGLNYPVAPAQFDEQMGQSSRYIPEDQVFDTALDFLEPQTDELGQFD